MPLPIKQKLKSLLIWSQRWTKTDMIYAAKGGFWITFEKITFNALGAVSIIAFANLLSRESYGIYQYILSVAAMFSIFNLPGVDTALTFSVAAGREGSYFDAFKSKLKFGLIATLVSLSFSVYYFWHGNSVLGLSFAMVGVFLPIVEALYLYNSFLLGKKQFKHYSSNNIAEKIICSSLIIIALFFTKSVPLIILAFYVPRMLIRIYFIIKYWRLFPPNKEKDSAVIGFGKHLTIMNVLGIVSSQIDNILVFQWLGAAPAAIYAFAITPISKMQDFIMGNINSLAMPKVGEKSELDLKRIIPKKVARLTLLILPLVAVYILAAPFIFKILLPQYAPAVIYTQILSLTLLFQPKSLFSLALTAQTKKKELYIANTLIPALKIILFFALLPFFGIWGMVAAIVFSEALSWLIFAILYKKS
ncbi:MAG: oligosaccharide flippase family protein [Patescibacteria group bacterium]|nr:oligosaccharide flippase family protein [Patescibacteria group bacterium]